jgi:hypothetical protein
MEVGGSRFVCNVSKYPRIVRVICQKTVVVIAKISCGKILPHSARKWYNMRVKPKQFYGL